jgi:hypothetical protein
MSRGRPVSIRRSAPLEVSLDEELRARLDIKLWSEAEQRVPKGAYKSYFDRTVSRDLADVSLDLAPYAGTSPGTAVVRCSAATLETLKSLLEVPNVP